jgi:alanyl-tRNA synthetase
MGTPHPKGNRIVNIQKCVRTGDIDDVGDNRHLTFFEMLGNWSFGDYFKQEAIAWSYELLTSTEEGFGLDPSRLYVTCFAGDKNAPRDEESAMFWQKNGVPSKRIFFLGAEDNWWSPGDSGPCGPDTEMFYDLNPRQGSIDNLDEFKKATKTGRVVEIWNDVFMEYEKRDGKVVGKLAQQNVDTGAGLERLSIVLQDKQNVFETDLFVPIMNIARTLSPNERSQRILSDHMRSAVFMIADGVTPSNTERGYVLRRLIRRGILHTQGYIPSPENIKIFVNVIVRTYSIHYPELQKKETSIITTLTEEVEKFSKTLSRGLKEFEKMGSKISGENAMSLFTTYGFPFEIIAEVAKEKGIAVDEQGFSEAMKKHRDVSRVGSDQKFKGGLADASNPAVIQLHTATHLLNAALKKVLGSHIKQKGSNITPERLRFDFSHGEKLTEEQKKLIETYINGWIKKGIPVMRKEIPKEEAEKLGAEMEFGAKYPDIVSIYEIVTPEEVVSREFCGGPHVDNTRDIGGIHIVKEEAVAAGVRRIKAVVVKDL